MSGADRCPVCQARFRGVSICSRCGADLSCLMRLSAEAWQRRQAARTAIAAGDFKRCVELANQAQETRRTPAGEALRTIGAWLASQ